MDASELPFLLVLGGLLVCSAFASASETAFFGMSQSDRAVLRRTHPQISRVVERLLANPRALLTQVLTLNMMTNVGYFVITSVLTMRADSAAWQIGISLGALFAIVLVGEVFAKLVAAGAPNMFLTIAAPIHALIFRTTRVPMGIFDRWVIAPLTRLAAPSGRSGTVSVSSQEMEALIELSKADGVICAGEEELLQAIVGLSDLQGEAVMTPRVDIAWVDVEASRDEVLEAYEKTGRSRFPVCNGSLDDGVLGVVDARAVLEGASVREVMVKPVFVPEQTRLDQLVDRFRDGEMPMALCVDEHGGVSGLVSLTDVVDELLKGYAEPEDDSGNAVEKIGEGRWLVPGRLGIRDWVSYFANDTDADFEHTKQANTLGGLVMVLLGRLPTLGDEVRFGGATLRVAEMHKRSVYTVEVILDGHDDSTKGGES